MGIVFLITPSLSMAQIIHNGGGGSGGGGGWSGIGAAQIIICTIKLLIHS